MNTMQKLNSQCALLRRRSEPRMGGFGKRMGDANILGQWILITTVEPSSPDADVTVEQSSSRLRQQHRTSLENISHEWKVEVQSAQVSVRMEICFKQG